MNHSAAKFIAFCVAIALFTSAPIWGVQYFINQDGPGHVHAAWTMLELLRGEPRAVELYQFNLLTFPNVTGHWIQAVSLLFVSPFVSTKLMLSLTYLGLVASIIWLRWCTAGRDGLSVSLLVGAVIGFNWLWLVGAYNFNIGLAIALIAAGCYYKWQAELSARRLAILAGLAITAFLSHIVGFLVLGVAVGVICIFPIGSVSREKVVRTAIIFLPAVPFLLLYATATEAGGSVEPVWRSISDPFSVSQWIDQIRSVDSLYMIRRGVVPFVPAESSAFLVFAPLAWLGVVLGILIFVTLRSEGLAERLPFAVLAAGFIAVSFFSPDDLQYSTSTGGLMRQRLFLAGLSFLIPIFRLDRLTRTSAALASAILLLVISFQTAALWEYAIRSDRDAREFFSAADALAEEASIAAVVIEPKTYRFVPTHMSSINNYNATLRRVTAWDNYEFAHYLFPVIARKRSHQEFVMRCGSSSKFDTSRPDSLTAERLETLERCLASTDPRIDTLVVWGSHGQIDAIVNRNFGQGTALENGRVRVFKR